MAVDRRPLVGITIGDPAGIGPEVVLKALAEEKMYTLSRPLVIGDARIMERALGLCHLDLPLKVISSPKEVEGRFGLVEVLDLQNADPDLCSPGQLSAACGRAAVEYVFKATDLALANEVDAIVTAPLNKEAMRAAGFAYDGHTEILAERTGTKDYAMMLVVGRFRVIHVSTHCSLREAIEKVKTPRVLSVIRLAEQAVRGLGVRRPRVAVSGLNPHAGEHGLFGDEEAREIAPAVEEAKAEGIEATGPYPPDTIYARAKRGEFDIVVAMYHDQGHIPIKLVGFHWGVNVTVGLSIIRASVDHGTAFDIAGKGIADARSIVETAKIAAKMARSRKKAGR
ncbi:MAG: 4-hydroxythreonine-4-phosphate dehydrogenase PdxA [candidate division NC10 bacterium]|nr:4-hydroxythreonine-4-phosphate dehydrogenase PdxA [candidate division NC10 bacterium]